MVALRIIDTAYCGSLILSLSRREIAQCQCNTRQEGSDSWDGRKLLDDCNGLPDKYAAQSGELAVSEQTRRRAKSPVPSRPLFAQKHIRTELNTAKSSFDRSLAVTLRLRQREVECAH